MNYKIYESKLYSEAMGNPRFVILNTANVLADDGQGYGYTSPEKAEACLAVKLRPGAVTKKGEPMKLMVSPDVMINKLVKKNPEIVMRMKDWNPLYPKYRIWQIMEWPKLEEHLYGGQQNGNQGD